MISLKEFMELISYKISDTAEFQWQCYGDNAIIIDSWDGHQTSGSSVACVFDTVNQFVYELSICDYANDRAYRWGHPDFRDAYEAECSYKNISDVAWDNVPFINLEEVSDFLEKAKAIIAGTEYDTRVQLEVEFADDELFQYMKLAHEMDITFNKLVELALTNAIEQNKKSHIVTDSAF